jgi:hypothetical protein
MFVTLRRAVSRASGALGSTHIARPRHSGRKIPGRGHASMATSVIASNPIITCWRRLIAPESHGPVMKFAFRNSPKIVFTAFTT